MGMFVNLSNRYIQWFYRTIMSIHNASWRGNIFYTTETKSILFWYYLCHQTEQAVIIKITHFLMIWNAVNHIWRHLNNNPSISQRAVVTLFDFQLFISHTKWNLGLYNTANRLTLSFKQFSQLLKSAYWLVLMACVEWTEIHHLVFENINLLGIELLYICAIRCLIFCQFHHRCCYILLCGGGLSYDQRNVPLRVAK